MTRVMISLLALLLAGACARTLPVQSPTTANSVDEYLVAKDWRKMAQCMKEHMGDHMVFGELNNPSLISFRYVPADRDVRIIAMHASTRVAVVKISMLDHANTGVGVSVHTRDRPFLTDQVRNHARGAVKKCRL